MAQHLIDTDIQVAQCPRCKAYAFKAHCSGYLIAADPSPLAGMDEVRTALLAGKNVHKVLMRSDRPWRLKTITPGDDLTTGLLVADHACGIRPVSAHAVEEVPEVPQQAPARLGRHQDGLHHQMQPAEPSQGHTGLRADTATHHRSDRPYLYRRCYNCHEMMGHSDPFGIMIGDFWKYVWHDPCPTVNPTASNVLGRAKDYLALNQLFRKGKIDLPIETLQLPEVEDPHE